MSEWKKVELTPIWNKRDENKQLVLKNGDTIEGIFMGVQPNVGPNKSNLYTIRTSSGTMSVWGSTVLDIRLKNLITGEEVKIVYLGLVESKKIQGRIFHNYDVYHREKEMSKIEEPPVVEDNEDIGEPPF